MTTQSKHTPGPWKIAGDHSSDCDIWVVNPITSETICSLHLCANPEANSRLIAAAPELLEVLTAAKAHMENPYPSGDDLSHILTRADAAIAKARGEQLS